MKPVLLRITAVVTLLLAGCSSSTVLKSNPNGAKIYVNGSYQGTTPCTYSDDKIVGSRTFFTLKLDGYQDCMVMLVKNEQTNVLAVATCFLLVPLLWLDDYYPEHTYELQKEGTISDADAAADSSSNGDFGILLRHYKKMLDDRAITNDEYISLRRKAINNSK